MAYTLKSAWSSSVIACLAVDDDNTTVKDFKSGNTGTFDTPNVTTGTATFKGVTRPYFETKANGSFNYYGYNYNGTKPTLTLSATCSFICLLNNYVSSTGWFVLDNGQNFGIKISSGRPQWFINTSSHMTGTTALATSTKQSISGIWRSSGTCELHYGLESGSMSQEVTHTDTGFGSDVPLTSVGGASGQGNTVANIHLLLWLNRALTNTERDNIHADYVGTLFDTGASSGVPVKMAQYRRRWSG